MWPTYLALALGVGALLFGLVFALSFSLSFASIGSEVLEGESRRFDGFVLRLAQSVRAGRSLLIAILQALSARKCQPVRDS